MNELFCLMSLATVIQFGCFVLQNDSYVLIMSRSIPTLTTYGSHSLRLIHLTLASIWCSVENFFLGLGRGIGVGVIPSTPGHKLFSLSELKI